METETLKTASTATPTNEQINRDLLRFMKILSDNTDNTKTTMKGFEVQLAEAVKKQDDNGIQEYQNKITDLIYDRMQLPEAAKTMTSAIFSDIRNLDPNWWAVNKVIGRSTTNLIWGYEWSTDDQAAFINFINIIKSDPKSPFTRLATLLRSSEENSRKYYSQFVETIENVQNQLEQKMSQRLVDTLIEASSYPVNEQELETLFDNLVEPRTW
ncbi:hypothetical protein ABW636_09580 [Aquimarina sp. 2201CG1-2-11]|uniref:hypothetical protein n=1 Tax=Aquimarina discodermiae TaxID=3231043 RepID=UPI003462E684